MNVPLLKRMKFGIRSQTLLSVQSSPTGDALKNINCRHSGDFFEYFGKYCRRSTLMHWRVG